MTPREACNCAYFHIVKDMREEDRAARMVGHKFDASLEDRIMRFEEKIGLRPDHDALALWMHRNILLPARGLSEDEIAELFDEGVQQDVLPAGIAEEHRWRFEDKEYTGLEEFDGNPWELPGMNKLRAQAAESDREAAAEQFRDTL